MLRNLLCSGRSTLNCEIEGIVHFVDDVSKEIGQCKNKIIVSNAPSPEIVLLMREAQAIITKTGGMTCHVAIVSREMGLPAIVGVKAAYEVLKEGMQIKIISNNGEGKIYAL